MLADPTAPGWSEAIRLSMNFGDAVLNTFDRFGHTLLTLEAGNDATADRLVMRRPNRTNGVAARRCLREQRRKATRACYPAPSAR